MLDLDGVLYVGGHAVPGAVETLHWLASQDVPFRFLTNTSSIPREAIVEKLTQMGIPARQEQLITPVVAAVAWLRERRIRHPALFVPAATKAEFADLEPLPEDAATGAGAVVIGDLGDQWDFATLNRAFRLLVSDPQVPLIALGLTRYWRAGDGLRMDVGAFVRALEYAASREAVVLGKPDPAFFRSAVTELGMRPQDVSMVGDDIRSDVAAAQQSGLVGVLVRTGKFSAADLLGDIVPDAVLDSVAELPQWLANS